MYIYIHVYMITFCLPFVFFILLITLYFLKLYCDSKVIIPSGLLSMSLTVFAFNFLSLFVFSLCDFLLCNSLTFSSISFLCSARSLFNFLAVLPSFLLKVICIGSQGPPTFYPKFHCIRQYVRCLLLCNKLPSNLEA